MEKEELLRQLEYIKSVLEDLKQNDGERSFYCYQKNQIEEELKELEKGGDLIERQDQRD
ncbi:MAG: hypothetical protein IJI98_11060 [Methanosphaera sp.]|nr:hypothetical protein [Methanobrevibacter sp.]MBQ6754223.1 hypothetical protein [Bacteroidales bacterium]MBR0351333.1 hypothetical protein [Clostridia bacterium]MBR0473218.1 hypothetical protein [Methanosphaera sp.]